MEPGSSQRRMSTQSPRRALLFLDDFDLQLAYTPTLRHDLVAHNAPRILVHDGFSGGYTVESIKFTRISSCIVRSGLRSRMDNPFVMAGEQLQGSERAVIEVS
jgi:hypothetical protein